MDLKQAEHQKYSKEIELILLEVIKSGWLGYLKFKNPVIKETTLAIMRNLKEFKQLSTNYQPLKLDEKTMK
jgi:hypothetical protein